MTRAATISIILFFFLVVASPGFCGSIGVGKGYVGNSHKLTPHHRFNYGSQAQGRFRNNESKFGTVKKHPNHPLRFFYDPRFVYYGGRQLEKTERLEVTLKIIHSENDEPVENPVKKKRLISSPHMVTLPNIATDEYATESVILIRGAQVSETP